MGHVTMTKPNWGFSVTQRPILDMACLAIKVENFSHSKDMNEDVKCKK